MLTKEYIVNLLRTKDVAIARALVALNARQEEDERVAQNTIHRNGAGFRPCHAQIGSSMANFYTKNKFLSQKQIQYWRTPQKDGKMRIEIYANQLLRIAMEKQKNA